MAKWFRRLVSAGWHREPRSRPFRPGVRAKRGFSGDYWWRAIVALVLTMTAETAHVGQLHIKKIELGELIQRSAHIVIAVPDDQPSLEEQVVIKARGKKPPPYVRLVHRYRVRESLRGDLATGTAIAVAPADDALQERLHREYYTEGLSRHAVVDFYEPKSQFGEQEPRILFLAARDGRFAYARNVGAEGLGMRSEIERQLGASGAPLDDPREAHVDLALLTHGYFGPYGDLRAGLKVLRKTCEVQLTNVADGIRVDIVPRDRHGKRAEGHEYQFVVTSAGTIDGFMAGEESVAIEEPQMQSTQPPGDAAHYRQFALRDVQGLHGGRNVTVFPEGRVVAQIVSPTETGLHERRFEMMLTKDQQESLRQLLSQHPPARIRIPMNPGIPDQARPEISLTAHDGSVTTVAKWDDDRHKDFDALYDHLLRFVRQMERTKPHWEGLYDRDWQPE